MDEKNTINTNKTIVLELNYRCNLKCVHCYVPDVEKKDSPFLSLKDAKHIFDEMELNGFDRVLFTGGEPFATVLNIQRLLLHYMQSQQYSPLSASYKPGYYLRRNHLQ